jgi:hypothetical protein
MLSSILPTMPAVTSLLPTAGAVGAAVPAAFAQFLGGISSAVASPPKDEAQSTLLAEFASRHAVNDPKAPLNQAGLPQDVGDGEFTVHVRRVLGAGGGQVATEEHVIRVSWPDESDGTSLQDVVAAINKVAGLKASVADDGRLVIMATDKSVSFRLGEDSSGLLEALGSDKTPLREAFDGFVGNALYGQMLASMRKSQGKPAYFHGGRTEEIFQGQLDQELVKRLTTAQGGDLSQAMYEQQFSALRR